MFRKSSITFLLLSFALMSTLMSACEDSSSSNSTKNTVAKGLSCQNGKITFDGSTALYPLANALSKKYQDACEGATITAKQSGSGAGLTAVSGGNVQIGNSDIFADAKTYPGLVDHQVAVVVFSVVLNSKVTGVTNLTTQQLIDIYNRNITNWQDVGGPDLPIVTVSRTEGSGTRVTFDTYVLNGGTEATGTFNLSAGQSSELVTKVKNVDGAIGYVTTFYAKTNKLTTIKIDGVSDDDANVKNNTYKFWNIEHMYTKGTATSVTKAFIDYVASDNPDVQKARTANGFLALGYLDASAVAAKQPK